MTEPTPIDTAARVIERLRTLRDRGQIAAFGAPLNMGELLRQVADVRAAFESGKDFEERLIEFANWACWEGVERALAAAVDVAADPSMLRFHVDE